MSFAGIFIPLSLQIRPTWPHTYRFRSTFLLSKQHVRPAAHLLHKRFIEKAGATQPTI